MKYYLLHPTSMGHKQTPGYHKTRVLNKVRLFDRFQSKESELDRFEKLGSYAALMVLDDPLKKKMSKFG